MFEKTSWKKEDCVTFYYSYEMGNQGIRTTPNCLKKNFNCGIVKNMNPVESKLQAITTSIVALENSKKPNQTLLKSLRKERDSILDKLEV